MALLLMFFVGELSYVVDVVEVRCMVYIKNIWLYIEEKLKSCGNS